jgi:hypothetical protein
MTMRNGPEVSHLNLGHFLPLGVSPPLDSEPLNFLFSARSVPRQEELVELRWLNPRPREHGVRLTPVMNLVHEEVREHRMHDFSRHPVLSSVEGNHSSESNSVQRIAVLNEARIRSSLRGGEVRQPRIRNIARKEGESAATLLESVEVVLIDKKNVVERTL